MAPASATPSPLLGPAAPLFLLIQSEPLWQLLCPPAIYLLPPSLRFRVLFSSSHHLFLPVSRAGVLAAHPDVHVNGSPRQAPSCGPGCPAVSGSGAASRVHVKWGSSHTPLSHPPFCNCSTVPIHRPRTASPCGPGSQLESGEQNPQAMELVMCMSLALGGALSVWASVALDWEQVHFHVSCLRQVTLGVRKDCLRPSRFSPGPSPPSLPHPRTRQSGRWGRKHVVCFYA